MKLVKTNKILKKNRKFVAGASTFSKNLEDSAYQHLPFATEKGSGAYAYDYDGNRYIDTIMSLGAVILGHANKEVNASVIKQIKKGSTLSLTTRLEGDLSELLVNNIPSAEMVRFGKHGNDATTAAVRLARHYSGKDNILFCGYHGWQDWYISKTSMNSGIPADIGKYSHRFNYNNPKSLDDLINTYHKKIACIIMEPISKELPKCGSICRSCKKYSKCQGFLNYVRKVATKNNIILIFDEVVTGFRWDLGGYQKKIKVIPDLSCFSKAMGNGFPISALVGKKEIMKKSNEIFYSLTFGSDPIAMAASISTINFLKKNNGLTKINNMGNYFLKNLRNLINKYHLEKYIDIIGFSVKNILIIKGDEQIATDLIRNFLIQLLAKNKVLNLGFNIFSYSHNKKVTDQLLIAYEKSFYELNKQMQVSNLKDRKIFKMTLKSARDL
tara:strand:- start:8981 stop:10303 length:1323 start_codon:yes stop_codon:yes gene_type:complete